MDKQRSFKCCQVIVDKLLNHHKWTSSDITQISHQNVLPKTLKSFPPNCIFKNIPGHEIAPKNVTQLTQLSINVSFQVRRQRRFLQQRFVTILGFDVLPLNLVQMGDMKFYCGAKKATRSSTLFNRPLVGEKENSPSAKCVNCTHFRGEVKYTHFRA